MKKGFLTELLSFFFPFKSSRRDALALFSLFAAFVITSQIGIFLYKDVGTSPALIWAPIGLSLGAVILGGYKLLPAIFWGSIVSGILSHTSPLLLASATVANTIQPSIAYYVLERTGFNRRLSNIKDMFLLLIVSVTITVIVPTFAVGANALADLRSGTAHQVYWVNWWVGGALSALILAPLLIRWVPLPFPPNTKKKALENVLSLAALWSASFFLFATTTTTFWGISIFYPFVACFIWIAFRGGAHTMTLGLFGMTLISLLGAVYGVHAPPLQPLSTRLFTIEVFDLLLAVLFFMMVFMEEQRKEVIKELRENSLQLESALREIRDKDEAKNEFIAILAHELRNPLATLLSSAELLSLDSKIKGESQDLIGIMQSRILTMSRLLNDLLDIARINRKEITIHKEKAALSLLVRQALETVGHALQKKNQTLGVSIPIEPVTLEVDPVRVEQALINLLYNAVKYTPEGGHIDLTAKYLQGVIDIRITDTGVGIPENMLTRIFDPFVQVVKGSPAKTEGLGTGLGIGLALTKDLVELHGGTIEARKNPEGPGSEFIVKLSAMIEKKVADSESKAPHPLTHLSGKKSKNGLEIFVVDDNVAAAESLSKLLALKGHSVTIANSGKEALSNMPKRNPHAILLDLGLGDMDGCDVAKEIRKENKDSVLIAITGYGQAKDKERTEAAGFQYHMTKPVGLAELEAVLEEITA